MNRRRLHPELEELKNDPQAGGPSKLSKLLRGRAHTQESKIPESDITFVWRVLSGHEKQACLGDACARFQEIGIPPELRAYNDLEDELAWQIIGRAMRDPDHPGTDANPYPRQLATVDQCRDHLTVDERDILLSEYMDLEESVDPDPMHTPEAWFEEVMSALKKPQGEREQALKNFDSRTLTGFLLSLDPQQLRLPTGNSSGASPSGTTSSDESQPN